MNRRDDVVTFYGLMTELERRLGGKRRLRDCDGRMSWPSRGVYFFFEDGESRIESGSGQRVVRVGTHGLRSGSRSTLWQRLSQHRGASRTDGGNHRGSIFRLLVGASLMAKGAHPGIATWGQGANAPRHIREQECRLEAMVSETIGIMPFVWLGVDDSPGPESLRGYIERNAIALLSNFIRPVIDEPSPDWLGRYCPRQRVRQSGLWNSNHVDEDYEPSFLDRFEQLVRRNHGT